jgi:hypothetical protein
MIYFRAKFNISDYCNSLVIFIKPKVDDIFAWPPCCYFTFDQNFFMNRCVSFKDPLLYVFLEP